MLSLKLNGKCPRGRPRLKWMDQVNETSSFWREDKKTWTDRDGGIFGSILHKGTNPHIKTDKTVVTIKYK